MGNAETREKILSACIAMFNARMASNVSTVQIAKALGISTGNMYYYYKNKEHIIRSLWQDKILPEINSAADAMDDGRSEHGIIEGLLALSEVVLRYRFFFSELPALVHNDPELKCLYQDYFQGMTMHLVHIMGMWIELGIMLPVDGPEQRVIAENLCCAIQSLPFLLPDAGECTEESVRCKHLFEHVYAFLRPYLSYTSNERIRRLWLVQ